MIGKSQGTGFSSKSEINLIWLDILEKMFALYENPRRRDSSVTFFFFNFSFVPEKLHK